MLDQCVELNFDQDIHVRTDISVLNKKSWQVYIFSGVDSLETNYADFSEAIILALHDKI